MIDSAQRTLDLQYFIFRGDAAGGLVHDALLRAAARGVRVRILVDDGDTQPGDDRIVALDGQQAIQVRVFNPFSYRGHSSMRRAFEFLLHAPRLDYRMHNKLIVADNSVALVGGRNIGDQYFQVDPASQFADDDVFAAGPIAVRLSALFDEFWRSPISVPAGALQHVNRAARTQPDYRRGIAAQAVDIVKSVADREDYVTRIGSGEPLSGLVSGRLPLVWAGADVVADSPDKKLVAAGTESGRLMSEAVLRQAQAAQKELLIVTPYLIPAPEEVAVLGDLRRRAVMVSILTNSLESNPDIVAHAGYTTYRTSLVTQGISVFEIRATPGRVKGTGQPAELSRFGRYALHAKLFVFDKQDVFIGSMNWDRRSKFLNTEVGLIIHSPELARQTASRFASLTRVENAYALGLSGTAGGHLVWTTQESGVPVIYETEPSRSRWRRWLSSVLAWVPMKNEL